MQEKKIENIIKILEILAIAVAAIILVVFKFIPEFKKTLGSSDSYVDIDNYDTIVEVKILSGPNFFLVTNDDILTNILFINDVSCILYNENIEGRDIVTAINKLTTKLVSEKVVNTTPTIQLTEYPKNKKYNEIKNAILTNFSTAQLQENTSSLIARAAELDISSSTEQQALQELQLYSIEIAGSCNNSNDKQSSNILMSKEEAKQYADQIYEKLQNYSLTYPNQAIDSSSFPVQLIPITTSNNNTIYPSSNSWYYIENGNVYAYIAFLDISDYSFCYQGNKENIKEGVCS